MMEDESIKDYANKVMRIMNQLRLLGKALVARKIVNKVLVSLPKKFKAKILSLENFKDLSRIIVTELMNALLAQEQRKAIKNKHC